MTATKGSNLPKKTASQLEGFQFHLAGRGLIDFILNDFSRWYIKLVRDRVSPSFRGKGKEGAQFTLNYVLERLLRLLAPVSPFISEKIYQDLFPSSGSVHSAQYPKPEAKRIHKELEEGMIVVKGLIENMNALRQEKKAKLRWPIDKAFIQLEKGVGIGELLNVVKSMGNVKEVVLVKKLTGQQKEFPGGKLSLGAVLKEEALVRELIRSVQELRKKASLKVTDQIVLQLSTDSKTESLLAKFQKELVAGTGSKRVCFGAVRKKKGRLEFDTRKIDIGF